MYSDFINQFPFWRILSKRICCAYGSFIFALDRCRTGGSISSTNTPRLGFAVFTFISDPAGFSTLVPTLFSPTHHPPIFRVHLRIGFEVKMTDRGRFDLGKGARREVLPMVNVNKKGEKAVGSGEGGFFRTTSCVSDPQVMYIDR